MIPTQIDEKTSIRSAQRSDRNQIANLMHFEPYTHRHLDWRPPLDWIGNPPYYIAETGSEIFGALSCPIDPRDLAWIRLFTVASQFDLTLTWKQLWEPTIEKLMELGAKYVASIPMQNWFRELLVMQGFRKSNDVIMMAKDLNELPSNHHLKNDLIIRMMNMDDIEKVYDVDEIAFDGLWKNSLGALQYAYQQSALATVAEKKGVGVVGYSISTVSPVGGHLARLAVHPEFQSFGIGYQLTLDVLRQFQKRGSSQVTVNTQVCNKSSINLYEKLGFQKTGEIIPVFMLSLDDY